MSKLSNIPGNFTDIVPAFLVRGTVIVQPPGGPRRRVQVSRIIPAATPADARVAALSRVVRDVCGAGQPATRARWIRVSAKWIANQYMWTFDEDEGKQETSAVPDGAQGGN